MKTVGRNEPCPCGSGKKYKNCHMKADAESTSRNRTFIIGVLIILFIIAAIANLVVDLSTR